MAHRIFSRAVFGSVTLGELDRGRANNFNFLRCFLALLVIFGHSFLLLLPQSGVPDPVTRFTRGQMTSGSWAVQGFFIISGFLIAQSWERHPSLTHFAKNRALRIYPGWIAALLVCVFAAAPLGGAAWETLLRSRDTWLFFAPLWLHSSPALPGVFSGNPVPGVVNGSLWTIPLEIMCYMGAALCGLCSVGSETRRRWCVALLFLAGLLLVKFAPSGLLLSLPWFGNLQALPFFGTCFLAGMMIQQFRDYVPHSWPLFLACLGIMGAAALRKQGMAIPFILCGSYALLFTAFLPLGLFGFGRRFDLSYGIYLYAYPLQQLVIEYAAPHLTPLHLSPLLLFVAVLPPTLLAAAASWFFVERPFLRLKKPLKNAAPAEASRAMPTEAASSESKPASSEARL